MVASNPEKSETGWLTPTELRAWRAFAFSSRLVMKALDQQLQADAGIPHSWFGMLVALSEQPDRTLRQSDLAGSVGFSPSRMSHAAEKMTQRGWLVRSPDPDDARTTCLTLSDDGLAALDTIARGHAQAVRAYFLTPLTPRQLSELGTACNALIDAAPDRHGLPDP